MLPANTNLVFVNHDEFAVYADLGHARDRAFEHLINRVFGGRMKPEPHDTRCFRRRIPEHVCEISVEREEDSLFCDSCGSNFFVASAGEADFHY